MDAYSTYVRENVQKVKKFEELARFGTIMLPKGPLGEVATEGSYALLGLVGVVNDAIIHGKTKRAGEVWSFGGENKQYQMLVTVLRSLLTFFAHCEALLEVAASKWATTEFRDRLVLLIELIKACARLLLLRWFPRECIYAGGRFESHVPAASEPAGGAANSAVVAPSTSWVGRRSGLALKVPASMQRYMDQAGQSDQLKRETQLRVTAEILHIIRPVIFVTLSKRLQNKWWSFFLSLSIDLASLSIFQRAAKVPSIIPSFLPGATASADATEFRRRTFLLFFYLFRTPLYEKSLGAFAANLVETFKNVPALATLAELIAFQLEFYHAVHFYSSAS